MGAQVSLETDGETIKHYFIGPCSGGLSVQLANNSHSPLQSLANNMVDTVQVLTPQAPLGKLIMGSFVNDEVFIEREGLRKTYRIIAIK
jgi:transcription elongation GreA/GreB family factor